MPTRTAKEWGTEAATSTNMNKMAGGWIGYATNSADQTGITTLVDVTDITVTVTVGTSRLIRVDVLGLVTISTNSANYVGRIQQDGSNAGTWAYKDGGAANDADWQHGFVVLTPSAGSHTYKATLATSSGSGTLSVDGTSPNQARILVTDLGPAS